VAASLFRCPPLAFRPRGRDLQRWH
jgi:hypothetical protein